MKVKLAEREGIVWGLRMEKRESSPECCWSERSLGVKRNNEIKGTLKLKIGKGKNKRGTKHRVLLRCLHLRQRLC